MEGFRLLFEALVAGPARRRPLRAVLPVLGVAVGVAAVAAVQHANRSVTESFREAAGALSGRSDFVVTGVRGVPLEALASFAFLWKYGAFEPAVTGTAVAADGSGEILQVLGVDPGGDAAVREMRLLGRPGKGLSRFELLQPRSVFLTLPFAERHHLAAGSALRIVAGGVEQTVSVAGLLELSGVARAAGGDLMVADLFTAQKLLGREGYADRVDVVLDREVSRDAVRMQLASRLPPGLAIEPPTRSAATADRMVRAFRFNLNALGSLTILVGFFLIANAVSISVVRRRPEIATLRALGASRGAVFAAFAAEGLAIGLAGTLLGEAGGWLAARAALRAVSGTISDIYLPTAKISAAGYGGAAALAAAVGLAASLAAALWPAAEATRVPPSPALRAGSVEAVRAGRLRTRGAAAILSLLTAAALSRAGPIAGFPFAGFAAVALVVAALAFAAPLLVAAVSARAALPLARCFGPPGRLAAGFFGGAVARNAIAVAALAMALGMTLAMIVTVASLRETLRVWVESTLRSDLWIKAQAGRGRGLVGDLPPDILPFLAGVPGVEAVDPFRARDATDRAGRPFTIGSGDFRVVARAGGVPLLDGRDPREAAREARAVGEVLVSEPYARRFGVGRGGFATLATPGGIRAFRVAGVYRDYSNDRGTVLLDRELYLSLFDDPRVTSAAVVAKPGTDVYELRRRISSLARGRYALSITTNRELARQILAVFDRTFAVTRGLEAIAVCVAILGIVNALTASAVERRRAFGLLAAVGADGGQIRRAVLLEAGLTGATAAAVSAAAAAAFAYLLLEVINPQSFGWTVAVHVPGARLAATVLVVLAASVLAGVFPGYIASGVKPATALQEE